MSLLVTFLFAATWGYPAFGEDTLESLKHESALPSLSHAMRLAQTGIVPSPSPSPSEESTWARLLDKAHAFIHRPDGKRDLFQAIQYLDRALAAAERVNDLDGRLAVHFHIGVVYANAITNRGQDSGKGKDADKLFENLRRNLQEPTSLSSAEKLDLVLKNGFSRAKTSFSFVIDHSKDLRQRTFARHFLANTAQAMGNFDEALEYLGQIEPQPINSSTGYDRIVISVLKARVLYAAGKKTEAANELKNAYKLATAGEKPPKEFDGFTKQFLTDSIPLAKKIMGDAGQLANLGKEKDTSLPDIIKRLAKMLP